MALCAIDVVVRLDVETQSLIERLLTVIEDREAMQDLTVKVRNKTLLVRAALEGATVPPVPAPTAPP